MTNSRIIRLAFAFGASVGLFVWSVATVSGPAKTAIAHALESHHPTQMAESK